MPLDLLDLSTQVRQMGEQLARRRADEQHRLELLDAMLADYRDRWEELADLAETVTERVAVPTGPLDERVPPDVRPPRYTALATDGAEIDPDRHGGSGEFYLINVGRVRIPYGQPERDVELRSVSSLGYTDEDLFIVDPRDPRRQVPMRDRHLDALRTVEELRALADLAESEVGARNIRAEDASSGQEVSVRKATAAQSAPAIALVDGTLLFSVLEERPRDFLRTRFYTDFVHQLERLRRAHVPVAAYASRSRGIDLIHLFRAVCGSTPLVCEVCSGAHACAMRGLNDAQLLGRWLDRWDRTGLFRVRSNVHDPYYGGHRVYFFLVNTGDEIARVEIPEWVARDQASVALVHAILVDQCAKGFGYPAVLARADDRAVISLGDRDVLDTLVQQELARQGVVARPSAKLSRKQVRTV
ncbi:MAG: DNA double-strand break repair nuclease NurA [Chloroflexi bacterium]|nr:DNA double-strand break repair nuclease NurA [Chloroflexota bacterium]